MSRQMIALDVGTSRIKALRLDAGGKQVATAAETSPRQTAAGVDPLEVWHVVCNVLRSVTAGYPAPAAVIVAGQGDGLWRIDADGGALPAFQWNSTRATDVVLGWDADGTIEKHFRASGTVLWPGTAAALWVWLKKQAPADAARTAAFFAAKDWISFKLTGEVATDVTDASIPFLDPRTGEYSSAAFERLGCEDLEPLAPPVRQPGEVLGTLTKTAAADTGLPEGTPVHVGCLDLAAMVRGLGLKDVGQSMAVLGTTVSAVALSDSLPLDREASGAVVRLAEGKYMRVMGATSGTTTLEWFLDNHGYAEADKYEQFWSDVNSADPGVLMLPYLAGERAPFLAPNATGTYTGITPATTRRELARATVEGLSFALRLALEAAGAGTQGLVLTGGGAVREEWRQLLADLTSTPVEVDLRSDSSLLGVASLVPGFADVLGAGEGSRKVYRAGPATAELGARYHRFLSLLAAMRAVWREGETK